VVVVLVLLAQEFLAAGQKTAQFIDKWLELASSGQFRVVVQHPFQVVQGGNRKQTDRPARPLLEELAGIGQGNIQLSAQLVSLVQDEEHVADPVLQHQFLKSLQVAHSHRVNGHIDHRIRLGQNLVGKGDPLRLGVVGPGGVDEPDAALQQSRRQVDMNGLHLADGLGIRCGQFFQTAFGIGMIDGLA